MTLPTPLPFRLLTEREGQGVGRFDFRLEV
jgi:hypothetical protein